MAHYPSLQELIENRQVPPDGLRNLNVPKAFDINAVRASQGVEIHPEISPKKLGINFIEPWRDDSGFLIGGTNRTELIKSLKTLNGVEIKDIEEMMRPGSDHILGSIDGFLGSEESLLEVLAVDNEFSVI